MFVAFEGVEGAGKTTLVGAVAERLGLKRSVAFSDASGVEKSLAIADFLDIGADISTFKNQYQLAAFNASRIKMLIEIQNTPNVKMVLIDRTVVSTLAFQGILGGGNLDDIILLNAILCNDFVPNIIFHIKRDDAKCRTYSKSQQEIAYEKAFAFFASHYPSVKIVLIDNNGNIDTAVQAICSFLA